MSLPRIDMQAPRLSPAPPPRVTLPYAVIALRAIIQASLQDCGPGWDLRRALRTLCDVARREGHGVEQLLPMLKQAWRSLPEVRELPPGSERDALLSRIISTCIEEFYAAEAATNEM